MKTAKKQKKPGKIFVISGPSGSGKTTLLSSLIQDKEISKLLTRSRSFTTRPKRSQEKDGQDYFFVSQGQFKQLLKAKKILEWTKYLGYYYGTPRELVETQLKKGNHLGLCLDLKGAALLKKIYPENAVTVFVLPPTLETLKTRIQGRCKCTDKKEVAQRLRLAREELLAAPSFDYCILNGNLGVALKELKEIVLAQIGF